LSSMISVSTIRHLSSTFFMTVCPNPSIFPAKSHPSLIPRPIPAHECKVVPSMLHAAIPVAAVMARRADILPPL
ncbi:hypothetical protein GGG16DRAFT_56696, partial [Schizophyllum commune]